MVNKITFIFMFLSLFMFNPSNVYSKGYDNILWRFAELHEGGDLEPSEFCYIAIKNNFLLMHWITPADPETIEVYKLNSKSDNKFCASKIESYLTGDGEIEITFEDDIVNNHKNICAKVSGDKMSIDNWIQLKNIMRV